MNLDRLSMMREMGRISFELFVSFGVRPDHATLMPYNGRSCVQDALRSSARQGIATRARVRNTFRTDLYLVGQVLVGNVASSSPDRVRKRNAQYFYWGITGLLDGS